MPAGRPRQKNAGRVRGRLLGANGARRLISPGAVVHPRAFIGSQGSREADFLARCLHLFTTLLASCILHPVGTNRCRLRQSAGVSTEPRAGQGARLEQLAHHLRKPDQYPEIRYTKEGQATAQLGVAVNWRWQDKSTQEWQEATSFFDVVYW